MIPTATLDNHNPPATNQCCLKPSPKCREKSDTPQTRPKRINHDNRSNASMIHPGFRAGSKDWSKYGIHGFGDRAGGDVSALFG